MQRFGGSSTCSKGPGLVLTLARAVRMAFGHRCMESKYLYFRADFVRRNSVKRNTMPWVVFEFKTGFHTPCHLLDIFVLFRSAALLTAVFGIFFCLR